MIIGKCEEEEEEVDGEVKCVESHGERKKLSFLYRTSDDLPVAEVWLQPLLLLLLLLLLMMMMMLLYCVAICLATSVILVDSTSACAFSICILYSPSKAMVV